ncbi:hypothetical protein Tco_1154365 [Tanacetum coccineum]
MCAPPRARGTRKSRYGFLLQINELEDITRLTWLESLGAEAVVEDNLFENLGGGIESLSGFGIGEVALSTLDVLQRFGFFLQMGFTLILATLDGLDVGLLGDVIDEDDCDDIDWRDVFIMEERFELGRMK